MESEIALFSAGSIPELCRWKREETFEIFCPCCANTPGLFKSSSRLGLETSFHITVWGGKFQGPNAFLAWERTFHPWDIAVLISLLLDFRACVQWERSGQIFLRNETSGQTWLAGRVLAGVWGCVYFTWLDLNEQRQDQKAGGGNTLEATEVCVVLE